MHLLVFHATRSLNSCCPYHQNDWGEVWDCRKHSLWPSLRGAQRRGISLRSQPQERFLAVLGMTDLVPPFQRLPVKRLLIASKLTQCFQLCGSRAIHNRPLGLFSAFAEILRHASRDQRRGSVHHYDILPRAVSFVFDNPTENASNDCGVILQRTSANGFQRSLLLTEVFGRYLIFPQTPA